MRKFNPLKADHPLIQDNIICQACSKPFKEGESTTLVPLGPGADLEAQEQARKGRAYNAVALPVHWACATGYQNCEGLDEME